MFEFKVKNKLTTFVYIIRAETKAHAINKAIEKEAFKYEYKDYKLITNKITL